MHKEANQFVKQVKAEYPEYFKGKAVLEVGSLDINGSVRRFFADCFYHGIDLGEGAGVDEVIHVTQLPQNTGGPNDLRFDVIISTEALEHDQHWNASLRAMYSLLKSNGLLVITCAGPTRAEHGTTRTDGGWASPSTPDYYRNISTEDFSSILPASLFSKSYLGYRSDHADLYFAGIKRESEIPPLDIYPKVTFPDPTSREYKSYLLDTPTLEVKPRPTVTVEVSTLNRLFTTLPMTIASIAMQTWKPDRLVLYDDGEQNELREIEPYTSLFHLLNDLGIPFETFKTPRLGLAANHQHALENATTDCVIRVDDDHVLQPRTLEVLMRVMTEDEKVGAVAPLIHTPGHVQDLPNSVQGKISDAFNGTNLQWYRFNSGPREAEHLHGCYLYRVRAAKEAGGYPKLSPVSHREDTWFSMKIARAGYKLIVTPYTTVHHLQQPTGGIRAFSDGSMWNSDNQKFIEWLNSIKIEDTSPKIVLADMGLGDHLLLKSVWPEIRQRHANKGVLLALCYPEVFEDISDVQIISIAEARQRLGVRYEENLLYHWCGVNNWNGPLTDAMLKFWG